MPLLVSLLLSVHSWAQHSCYLELLQDDGSAETDYQEPVPYQIVKVFPASDDIGEGICQISYQEPQGVPVGSTLEIGVGVGVEVPTAMVPIYFATLEVIPVTTTGQPGWHTVTASEFPWVAFAWEDLLVSMTVPAGAQVPVDTSGAFSAHDWVSTSPSFLAHQPSTSGGSFMLRARRTGPAQCTVSAPAGVLTGPVAIDATAATGASWVQVDLEWSPAGLGAWQTCTVTAASANPNPLVSTQPGMHGFEWDARADGAGRLGQETIDLRVTVWDGVSMATCLTTLEVDNPPFCPSFCGDCDGDGLGPGVLDALEAARIAASLVPPSASQQGCCDADSTGTITVLDALYIAQSAAGLPVTLLCP